MVRAEILGRERRRTWSDEDKLRILAEADAPEISLASVARRHDLCPQQLYVWRRLFRGRDGHGAVIAMGAFAEWQPRYADPVSGKAPVTKTYDRIGRLASATLVRRFVDAEAFGFAARPSRIVVLDIDAQDEGLLANALKRHGPTPFVVRTGSGNYLAWYRRTDEPRLIRPFPGLPIDILGEGNVVAPRLGHRMAPTRSSPGSIADLRRLPPMRNAPVPMPVPAAFRGVRNRALWRYCMGQAHSCDDFDTLQDVARSANHFFFPALDDAEVMKITRSAWGYTERGENWFDRAHVRIPVDLVDRLLEVSPDAYLLLTRLLRDRRRDHFHVANEMAERMPGGWTRKRFAAARKQLELAGAVVEVRSANSWYGPALYRWGR